MSRTGVSRTAVSRGPHRSEDARRAILASTATLLTRNGWGALTIEGIAADAGVGKQTIYRWWRLKSAIVADSLAEGAMLPAVADTPDTGDVLADVSTWLLEVVRVLGDPGRSDLIRSLIGAAVEDEQVAEALNDRLGGAPTAVATRLTSAVGSGELPRDAPVRLITESLLGAVILRVLYREPFGAEDASALARLVLGGATRRPS